MRFYISFILLVFTLNCWGDSLTIIHTTFVGNHKTKATYLNSLLSLNGRTINSADTNILFKQACQDLYNTKLFSSVECKHKVIGKELFVVFNLVERWYTFATPYFELIDRNFNEWWVVRNKELNRIIIGADFTQKNVSGRNDVLSLTFLAGNQSKFSLSYVLPNYYKEGKLGFAANFKYDAFRNVNYGTSNNQLQYSQEESIQLKRIYLDFKMLFTPKFSNQFWLGINGQNENVSDNILHLNPEYNGINTNSLLKFGIYTGLKIDSRDIRGYAQKGHLLWAEFAYYAFNSFKALSFPELNVRYTRHVPFAGKGDLALASLIKLSKDKNRPYYINRGLGWGVNSLRTYDYHVADGSSFFAQKASLRCRVVDKVLNLPKLPIKQYRTIPFKMAPKLFFDVGYVQNQTYESLGNFLNRPLYSYGFGLDFVVFDDAVWRFEYGWNHTGSASIFLNFTSAIQ